MAAEHPETQGAQQQPAAPAGVNQELPSVDVARQNFREKVQAFVDEFKKHEEPSAGGPFSDNYHKLQGFLDNSALPKRNQEKEIINAMTVMARQLESKKQAEKTMTEAAFQEMSQKFKGIIKEATTAEEEFDKAYEEDKNQSRTPSTPGFVVGTEGSLYQYNGTNQKTGEKTFGVMSTVNTREGFKDALNYYANSKDENGKSRKFTNVNFGKPEVSAQQLKESSGLRQNFHKQICDALDANLYPEREIEKYLEANAGPNMNSRGSIFTNASENKLKAQELQQLLDKIEDYKKAKDGQPRETGEAKASVVPGKTAKETVALSLKEKEAETTSKTNAPKPGSGP